MDAFIIGDELAKMDFARITEMLSKQYWSPGIKQDEVQTGAHNSTLVAGVFLENGYQIGYARVVSDKIRFAYILDVIIDDNYRNLGIGEKLIQYILHHPSLREVYQWLLRTKDAHRFYQKTGFKPVADPSSFMEIRLDRPGR